MNSIRYLGMNDFTEIAQMTLYEYDMRMTAYKLKRADMEYEIHLLAWESWNVQAMKKSGKKKVPVFKTFQQFFDHESVVKEILSGGSDKEGSPLAGKARGIAKIMKIQKEKRCGDAREL